MNKSLIINKTIEFVKNSLAGSEGGHDWWHTQRVWKTSKKIAKSEKVDLFIVELGALLHDIADSKFQNGDESIGPKLAREFLQFLNVNEEIIHHIENIIFHVSFKGGNLDQNFTSPELEVVQDADRLDAMGAIGIARAFNYGGYKNREIYNPNIDTKLNMTEEEYKKSSSPTINHFYEKLLLLKDKMNTKTGRKLAKKKHNFMFSFLKEFQRDIDI